MSNPISITEIDRDDPLPGERCQFHPGCCDEDDTTCPGCGADAIAALSFHRDTELFPTRRVPYCAGHEQYVMEAVIGLLQQQAAAQN